MKVFWHFFSSNIRYNKIELAISYIISAIVFIAFNYLKDPKKPEGDVLFSVAFYALLYAFYSNKRKFNLKYMLSLPLSKSQLLATKVMSDLVYFLPAIVLAFWGALHTTIPFDALPLLVILFEIIFFVSFIMFDSDIEQPRLENAKSSFLNRLIYVRKMADFGFLSIFVIYISVAVNLSPMSMAIKQYLLILLLSVVLFFKFNRSLSLMKDESMSYFIPRRDLFRIGWKVAIFAVPAFLYFLSGMKLPSKYGREQVFSMIQYDKLEQFEESIQDKQQITGKSGYTLVDAAIDSGNTEALDILLENGFKVNWDANLKTSDDEELSPIHLAVKSGELDMVKKVLKLKPKTLEAKTSLYKSTPLQASSIYCHPEITEFLLLKKAKVNYQNTKGNTALILSAANKCPAATVVLLEYGADPTIKNNDDKTAFNFVRSKQRYLLTRKVNKMQGRGIAGSSSLEDFPKLQPPKLLRQQK